MTDFYEIDFLDVESDKSGDAITMRYKINGAETIHLTDGGFQSTGDKIISHIDKYYGKPKKIHHVVVTHNDSDHAGGLRKVLEEKEVGALWMLRPWLYAEELIDRFSRFKNVDNLKARLKEIYPNIAALEEIAETNNIPIYAPFQGEKIGAFTVMSPTKSRYLDLVVASEKTPEAAKDENRSQANLLKSFAYAIEKAGDFIRSLWGDEKFSSEETSAENEMSVVQYASLCDEKILLTGDTGRAGLSEAADFAPTIGLNLPGINRFQIPHHGSRRNVSTETLDRWLGQRFDNQADAEKANKFSAIVSAAKKDTNHPRKAVVRAIIHRGGRVSKTEGRDICYSKNAPQRDGWGPVTPEKYPSDQED